MKKLMLSGISASLAALTLGYAPAGAAAAPSSYSLSIVGEVPTICRATIRPIKRSTGTTLSIGELNEFCNNPTGYEVHAALSGGNGDERLIVDGAPVAPDTHGNFLVAQSNSAHTAKRQIYLTGYDAGIESSISFRIVPL